MNTKKFSVIIPAAGKGIRLKPVTDTIPKVLVNVADNTILGHILDEVYKLKPHKIYIIVGHLGNKIKKFVKERYPKLDVSYITQKHQKGLGNAVMLGLVKIKEPVFVILGDTILHDDFKKIITFKKNTIAVKKVMRPEKYGVVEVKKGLITNMVEKPSRPKSNLAIVGAYFFSEPKKLLEKLKTREKLNKTTKGELQLTDAVMEMIKDKSKIYAVRVKNWYDCGTIKTLLEANRHLLIKKAKEPKPKNKSFITPNCEIINSAIGPFVSIGENVKIENCRIRNSIICKGRKLKNKILTDTVL